MTKGQRIVTVSLLKNGRNTLRDPQRRETWLDFRPSVEFLSWVEREFLLARYNNARIFIYCSKYARDSLKRISIIELCNLIFLINKNITFFHIFARSIKI